MLFTLVFWLHILLCIALIAFVLKQQGKGADMGAAFGGGSNTLFGAGGANNLVVKITTTLAVCFFMSSVVLIHLYRESGVNLQPNSPLTNSAIVDGMSGSAASTESAASSIAAGTTSESSSSEASSVGSK